MAENWERVLDDVGELESVEEPQQADELAAVVPVSASEGEFSLRMVLDELLHLRRIVVSSADGTSDQIQGATVFEAEAETGALVRE